MKPIKLIIALIIISAIISCSKKEVKLPVLGIKGNQDTIYNNTQIWIFYKPEDNDTIAKLNRNNMISTTHWLFNIDKRLPLKEIIPHIKLLQKKREKPSMHQSEEPVHNYYTYVDTINNKLSTLKFDNIEYITDQGRPIDSLTVSKYYKNISFYATDNAVKIDSLVIDDNLISKHLLKLKDSTIINLQLQFNKNLTYQKYIYYKALLNSINNDSIKIDNKEYIKL